MSIPHNEVLEFTTLTRALSWLKLTQSDNKALVSQLITTYSHQFAIYLERLTKCQARTVILDVMRPDMILRLKGWPVVKDLTNVPLVTIYNDASDDPSYADALSYPQDYRVYCEEGGFGRVEFITALLEGFQALKVEYTGGMGALTEVGGTAGSCVDATTFTQTEVDFIVAGVRAGQTLTIDTAAPGGLNNGSYPIASVTDAHTLTVTGAFVGKTNPAPPPATIFPSTDEVWEVADAHVYTRYPAIEQALINQIIFHWRMKDKTHLVSTSTSQGSASLVSGERYRPLELLPEVKTALDAFKLMVP